MPLQYIEKEEKGRGDGGRVGKKGGTKLVLILKNIT